MPALAKCDVPAMLVRLLVGTVLVLLLGSTLHAREVLNFEDLQSGKRYRRAVDLSAYAPGSDARPPVHVFEGRLKLRGQPRTRTRVADTAYLGFSKSDYRAARTIPQDFDYDFVQDDDTIIPVRRGPLPSSHGWWEFMIEPGRVWDEPGDHGYTRAAVPFSLTHKNQNCASNGVLMFLFSDQGAIDNAAFQVSSETCPYLHIDMWGYLDVEYQPGRVAQRAQIMAAWQKELAERIPVQPLSTLNAQYPGLDLSKLAIGDAAARTRYGVYIDGVHYVSKCPTRHGDYPYCEVLDLPSYSTAKTIVGGIAAMRMEKLYPGVMQEFVADHADSRYCRAQRWQDVSFMNLLDMATGNYGSAAYQHDEDSIKILALLRPLGHADKMRAACASWSRKSEPGETWVYHSSDTYLLGAVLQNFLRRHAGDSGRDVFADVVEHDVLAPLGLNPGARVTRRTYDEAAQPVFGWGLFLHADDMVKIGRFLGSEKGRIDGLQLLDEKMLQAAMQMAPDDRGLPVASLEKNFRYQHSVWARNVQSLLGCDEPVWVPFLSGYGGITIAMFPNGVIWYNVADDGEIASFDFAQPAIAIHQMDSLCQHPEP